MSTHGLKSTVIAEELAAARAERVRLQTALDVAEATVASIGGRLAAAERAWKEATTHTDADRLRLERLREQATYAERAAAAHEQQLVEVGARIAELEQRQAALARNEVHEHRLVLVAELYPPVVRRLIAATREMLAALKQQRATREHLYDEGALFGYVTLDELGIFDGRGSDDLPRCLRLWLAAAERSEYARENVSEGGETDV
jgi:hypothetical protein